MNIDFPHPNGHTDMIYLIWDYESRSCTSMYIGKEDKCIIESKKTACVTNTSYLSKTTKTH